MRVPPAADYELLQQDCTVILLTESLSARANALILLAKVIYLYK